MLLMKVKEQYKREKGDEFISSKFAKAYESMGDTGEDTFKIFMDGWTDSALCVYVGMNIDVNSPLDMLKSLIQEEKGINTSDKCLFMIFKDCSAAVIVENKFILAAEPKHLLSAWFDVASKNPEIVEALESAENAVLAS